MRKRKSNTGRIRLNGSDNPRVAFSYFFFPKRLALKNGMCSNEKIKCFAVPFTVRALVPKEGIPNFIYFSIKQTFLGPVELVPRPQETEAKNIFLPS